MSFLEHRLDSLFEENVPSPLHILPAEIRNMIFKEVVYDGEEAPTIKISETGSLILPGLSWVSKQFHAETRGYFTAALTNPASKIEATVRDYNPKPILAGLEQVYQQTGIPRSALVARTHVRFVGDVHMGNLLVWIQGNMRDSTAFPTFHFEKMDLPSCAGESVFDGRISLKTHLSSYEEFRRHNQMHIWNKYAREFLTDLADRRLDLVEPRLWGTDADLQTAVFKTFAGWHDIFLHKREIKQRVLRQKEKQRVEDDHFYVAQAMEEFGASIERAKTYMPRQ